MTTEIAKHPLRDKITGKDLLEYLKMTFPSAALAAASLELNGEQLKLMSNENLERLGMTSDQIVGIDSAFSARAALLTKAKSTKGLLSLLNWDFLRESHRNPKDDDID
jgi:hypothetical protein